MSIYTTFELLNQKFNVESFECTTLDVSSFVFQKLKGFPHTEETKLKISNAKRGRKINKIGMGGDMIHCSKCGIEGTPQYIQKHHNDNCGVKKTNSLHGKPQPTSKCPHCNKEGGVSIMKRHHFDNCKHKK